MQKNVKMANFFSFFSFFHRVRPLWRYKEDLERFFGSFWWNKGLQSLFKGWKVGLFLRSTWLTSSPSQEFVLMSPVMCRIVLVQELKVEKTKEPLGLPLLDLRLILGGWILYVQKCVFFKFRKFLAIKKVARRQFLQKLQKVNSEGW